MNYATAAMVLTTAAKRHGHKSVALSVQVWLGSAERHSLQWNIWCGDRNEHYYGRTFEETFAKYEQSLGEGQADATPDVLLSVGETERCECGAVFGQTHDCPALPRMDTPEMMGTEQSGIDPVRDAELDEAIRAAGLRP